MKVLQGLTNHACGANTKSDTEAASAHLDDFEGSRLNDGTDGLQIRLSLAIVPCSQRPL